MFDFQPIFLASMIVAQNVSEVSLPYGWLRDSATPRLRKNKDSASGLETL